MIRPVLIAFILACVLAPATGMAESPAVTIAYTANTSGKMRECGCPGDPYGGLSERVTLIRELRESHPGMLLLDAGNMVALYGDYRTKEETVLGLMNMMAYDVAGAGKLDLYNGVDNARFMAEEASFPIVSATAVTRSRPSAPVLEAYTIQTVGVHKVCVTSVCDSTAYLNTKVKTPEFDLLPVDRALSSVIGEIGDRADMLVVLSHLPLEDNLKLLERFPDVDLVVQAYGNDRFEEPARAGNGIVVSPGARGQFVGIVTLEKQGGTTRMISSELLPVLDYKEDPAARTMVGEYFRSLR